MLRKKWKNLRDYFGTEYSKRPVSRSGDSADCQSWTSKWQYFNQMLFLKDIVAPRKCSGSLGNLVHTVNEVATESEDSVHSFKVLGSTSPVSSVNSEHTSINLNANNEADDNIQDATSPTLTQMETSLCPTPPPNSRGKKRKVEFCAKTNSSQYDKLIDLEQQKLKLLTERYQSQDDNNDDLLFFKSLIPYVQNIPVERKMAFRSRVQMLVDEFTYGTATSHSNNGQMSAAATTHVPVYRSYDYCSSPDTYQTYNNSSKNLPHQWNH